MNSKTRKRVEGYVNKNIDTFHQERISSLQKLNLNNVLKRKNPYLFRAKNLNLAADLVKAILDARLSSSEEGTFGGFLEDLAIYVSEITCGGRKSGIEGIDIELERKGIRYLIAVKSGKNWGNAGQFRELRRDFKTAVRVIRQSKHAGQIQPTLGICYGDFETNDNGDYLHVGGQSFWHLISGDPELYIDLIEPIGYKAEQHDEAFRKEKDNVYNRMVREFTISYCDKRGAIQWPKLVRFVSGNMTS